MVFTKVQANTSFDVIPFEMINGHITVNISINDSQPLHFVFDTGAGTNLLSESTAMRLGLDLGGNTNIQGASGSSNMKLARNERFTFGKTEFKRQNFAVMDISHLGDEDAPIDGVLGASILMRYVVEIDYDDSEIRLYKSLKDFDTSGYDEYGYSLSPYRIPIIETTMELNSGKKVTGKYFVDTGAALSIMVNSNLVKEENLLETLGDHYPIISTSLSNSATDQISNVPSFSLFDHTFENIHVRLSQATQGVNSFEGYHGIIGIDLLKRFNTIFDYDNEKVYVKPNDNYKDPFSKNYSGLQVEKTNGHYRVIGIAKNSAADLAKLKKGDIIEKLDGKSFDSSGDFSDYFQNNSGKITVELRRNGQNLKLPLRPKPTIN